MDMPSYVHVCVLCARIGAILRFQYSSIQYVSAIDAETIYMVAKCETYQDIYGVNFLNVLYQPSLSQIFDNNRFFLCDKQCKQARPANIYFENIKHSQDNIETCENTFVPVKVKPSTKSAVMQFRGYFSKLLKSFSN